MERFAELVTSPLGDELLFHGMTVSERLGQPFVMHLNLLSTNNEIGLSDVLGKAFAVRVTTREHNEKHFHGIASYFTHTGVHRNYARYQVTLRPWLWLLSLTSDCRIFQEKKVPDIIKQVFRDQNFTDFEDRLSGTYKERVYCVQYRESDFDFVSRLMEHEGIYYYCTHEASKHTVVLADAYGGHSTASGYANVIYYPPEERLTRDREHLSDVSIGQTLQPGKVKVNSFDFVKPKADLLGSQTETRSNDHSEYEVYDYPGDYTESSDGDGYAKVRLQSYQSWYETLAASGDACGLGAGCLFTLEEYPRASVNKEYLIVAASHDLPAEEYETEGGAPAENSVSIEAIDSNQTFRCEKRTPAPVISGPQTAMVVGKSGEEIWTDEHGRIKVQFHWDREGQDDENSSCWIRVAQEWAGKKWGSIAIPRIGHEVLVHFINGDPDQPIVTGSVYNNDNKVPYDLPDNQTKSGIKSRSSKGGNEQTFNELRFEDKKDKEEIYFHAEKDFKRYVENCDELTIRDGDQTITLEGSGEEYEATGHQIITLEKGDQTIKLNGKASGHQTIILAKGDQTITLDQGSQSTTLSAGDQKIDLTGGDHSLKLAAGKSLTDAMQSITLKVGQSSLKIDQMGVTIKGMMVKIEGQTMTEFKAPMTTVKGDAMLTLKGGITMIN